MDILKAIFENTIELFTSDVMIGLILATLKYFAIPVAIITMLIRLAKRIR